MWDINHTNLILIPKKKYPNDPTDYRPISLCNVVYKLVAKVLANRLKEFLPRVIDASQSAFVKGRMIFDNIMVAHELMHTMKNKRTGYTGVLAAKLDMAKAYDKVEWGFLEGIMKQMGFAERWVTLIMNCVTSVSFTTIVNGKQGGKFQPTRGLRQGDPLSPYLFLLCAKGLVSLMKDAGVKRKINGIAASRGGPKIAHLFFADDSLFFYRAKEDECKELVRILDLYNRASRQEVNVRKSGMLFSKNTSVESRRMVMEVLGFQRSMENECYLGMPLLFGRSKAKDLRSIKERIRSKVNGWEGRLLSQAGRAVLVQAVGQAIPVYSMNCFKLPTGFLQEINMMLAGF